MTPAERRQIEEISRQALGVMRSCKRMLDARQSDNAQEQACNSESDLVALCDKRFEEARQYRESADDGLTNIWFVDPVTGKQLGVIKNVRL